MKKIAKNMKVKLAYSEEEINAIEFMHFLLDFNIETDLLGGIELAKRKGVNKNDAMIFGNLNNINRKLIKGLFHHSITTKGNGPEVKGLKGRDIRDKIQELEVEKFKNKWL